MQPASPALRPIRKSDVIQEKILDFPTMTYIINPALCIYENEILILRANRTSYFRKLPSDVVKLTWSYYITLMTGFCWICSASIDPLVRSKKEGLCESCHKIHMGTSPSLLEGTGRRRPSYKRRPPSTSSAPKEQGEHRVKNLQVRARAKQSTRKHRQ